MECINWNRKETQTSRVFFFLLWTFTCLLGMRYVFAYIKKALPTVLIWAIQQPSISTYSPFLNPWHVQNGKFRTQKVSPHHCAIRIFTVWPKDKLLFIFNNKDKLKELCRTIYLISTVNILSGFKNIETRKHTQKNTPEIYMRTKKTLTSIETVASSTNEGNAYNPPLCFPINNVGLKL